MTFVETSVMLSQAGFPGLWPECCLPWAVVSSVLHSEPLCFLGQESSLGSPWPPLLQADYWDTVKVDSCSLNCLSHRLTGFLFHRPSPEEAFVSPLLCLAAAQTPTSGILLSWRRRNPIPRSAFHRGGRLSARRLCYSHGDFVS